MIASMTGYAALTGDLPQGALQLEIKSVNSRFLDIQFRIGEELRSLEPALRELIAARVVRGKVDCRLGFTLRVQAGASLALNRELLTRVAALAREAQSVVPEAQPLGLGELLHWPGVLAGNEVSLDALREPALALARQGVAELAATREREGAKLGQMILERVGAMRQKVATLAPLMPQIVAAYQERLSTRLREVLASGDEERIRQEVAVFGVKIDVAEELSRLSAHLDEVERVIVSDGKGGGSAGKRLDFLMQELNREANTLGSKSVARELSEAAIELKLLIEQMREQIQNIE
jgi:uncharacterized protein (TIGR00255 family)